MSRNTPYNPEQWESGEVITQEKLQNIENGITGIDNNLRDLILVSKNNPSVQHPDNLLWFESDATNTQIPTYDEYIELQNTLTNYCNELNNLNQHIVIPYEDGTGQPTTSNFLGQFRTSRSHATIKENGYGLRITRDSQSSSLTYGVYWYIEINKDTHKKNKEKNKCC